MNHSFSLPDSAINCGPLRDFFPAWLERRQGYSRIVVIADTNTRALCLPVFLQQTGLNAAGLALIEIPAGEAGKNLSTCEKVWGEMLAARLDRKALAINLGGGVAGDLGGFCAATFKRGIDFVQIPTTLLSMTDAAIGGKLGIDFQGIKNTIGVFRHPEAVFVDPVFLHTPPRRELLSGFAEVIKHALIGAPELWQQIEQLAELDTASCQTFLPASIGVKVHVVTEDPLEKGLRALLNFGHTIGHALESYWLDTPDPLTHGEAVATGMICESWLAWGQHPHTEKISRLIGRFFPHRTIPESAFPLLWQMMQQDKKNAAGAVRIAVPDPAQSFRLHTIKPSREAVEQSLRYYNEGG